jgi:hypothetical protein
LNSNNKPYNIDRNELVFVVREADIGISNSGYLNLNVEAFKEPAIKLKKWILNAIKV